MDSLKGSLKGLGDWVKPNMDNSSTDLLVMDKGKLIVLAAVVGLVIWAATRK